MHQLVAGFLLKHSEVDPVRNIAVFNASAQNLLGVLCLSSIVRAISHKVLFFLSTTPFWGRPIWTRKLVFKTQVMAKDFKTRVSEF
jgi:hypothetical protein